MRILYFFIGTEAELMKMFRVILEAKKRGYLCKIISNGQNNIKGTHFLDIVGEDVAIDLTEYGTKEKSATGYLSWYLRTEKLGVLAMKEEIEDKDKDNMLMIVHGDTLSTLMGARIAQKSKINYVHVESGARSYNWLSPFPEEIDRYFSSRKSKINFCPKKEYAEYAAKAFKGKAVNTIYNTGIETLYYAIEENKKNAMKRPIDDKYFLLAIHRQENLLNEKFLKMTFEKVIAATDNIKCLFIYHEQTKNALEKFHIWDTFSKSPNVVIIPRQQYTSFVNCVVNSEYVVADGCGNQQEFYYLGKPYLIMRTKVEADSEGIGWNAEAFEGNYDKIIEFTKSYKKYIKPSVVMEKKPSNIIVDNIDIYFQNAGGKRVR